MNPALKDIRVRQDIALSIDKEAIIDDVMGGGAVARQLVGPASIGYNSNLEACRTAWRRRNSLYRRGGGGRRSG